MSTLIDSEAETPRVRLIREGHRIYEERLRGCLEPENIGRFVAIEPTSGRYFLGDTSAHALVAARAAMPDQVFCLMRVGYRAAHTVGGHVSRIR
jgi:hypothetical protein